MEDKECDGMTVKDNESVIIEVVEKDCNDTEECSDSDITVDMQIFKPESKEIEKKDAKSSLELEVNTFEGPKRRQTISEFDKKRIVKAYEQGHTLAQISKILDIKGATCKTIIYKYVKGLPLVNKRGGYRKPKITNEIGDKLLEFIDKNYSATLEDMRKFLAEKHDIKIGRTSICKYLHGKFISFKVIQGNVKDKNSEQVKEIRKTYAKRYLEEGWQEENCFYVDETSFNLWMKKAKGWGPKGQPLYHNIPRERGPNITLIMAIGISGIKHFEVIEGWVNHESYQAFMNNLSDKLARNKSIIIQDNAAIHRKTFLINTNHKLENLPPYSPFLNPIETAFGQLKSKVIRELTETQKILDMTANDRIQVLKTIVEKYASEEINFKSNYRHIMKYFPKCILMEDIFGD